ncbi:hypothetical protein CLD22_01985 [Rubrivivax gelatinosus]|nr:hypothetical protein [Rubrivivax gelatinosus]
MEHLAAPFAPLGPLPVLATTFSGGSGDRGSSDDPATLAQRIAASQPIVASPTECRRLRPLDRESGDAGVAPASGRFAGHAWLHADAS